MCNSDVGADVLDLAETMVASDGLKYEPVSYELCSCGIITKPLDHLLEFLQCQAAGFFLLLPV